jgi:hypothetical protein
MIDKLYGAYSLVCDVCGEEAEKQFFDFADAVEYKKIEGWRSKKTNGGWQDICLECQKP